MREIVGKIAIAIALAAVAPSCDVFMKPTKMAQGELYESGDAKYDAYFKKVHDEQVAASEWAEESKSARKPLTTALGLPLTAANSTILSSAKGKKDDAAVKGAADETAGAELELAKKHGLEVARLEELLTVGEELKKQAIEERRNMAADKADPAKVEKKDELKRELSAAVDSVSGLHDDAERGKKEAESLAESLRSELGVAGTAPVKKDEPEKEEAPKKETPVAKKASGKGHHGGTTKKHGSGGSEGSGAEPKAEKPASKPAPKPAATSEEVFNP